MAQIQTTGGASLNDGRPFVCLLGASVETGNLGVNALATGAIECVLRRWPHGTVFLLDYGTTPRTYDIATTAGAIRARMVNMRFSKKLFLPNHILVLLALTLLARLVPAGQARRSLLQSNACLAALAGADLALSVAGGDSFSDCYGLKRFLYIALPQLLCLLARKRLVLMPQTLGPFRHGLARVVAKYILRRAEAIYCRDWAGLRYHRELIGPRRATRDARFSPDLGLLLEPSAIGVTDIVGIEANRRPEVVVGLNVSGLLCRETENRTGPCLKIDYEQLIVRLIESLMRRENVAVILIPHVYGKPESDADACQKLYGKLRARYTGRLGWAAGSYSAQQAKYLIGRCDFFIGSRMHACIAAVSQCVPALSLAYSDKFAGVMESLGVGRLVADLRTLTPDEILARAHAALDSRTEIRAQIEERLPELRKSAVEVFAHLKLADGVQ